MFGLPLLQTGTPPMQPDDTLGCFTQNPQDLLSACVLPAVVESAGGQALFGLILTGTILGTMWLAGSGDIVAPAVILVLFGGTLIPILPPQYRTLAYSIIIIAGTAALYGIQRDRV